MGEKEISDAELVALQEELERLEGKEGGSSVLPTSDKFDMSKFFRDASTRKDTTRISKLTKQLIGEPRNSEMGLRKIGLYAKSENLNIVSEYLNAQANLIPELYMSKDGFFLSSAVTQIKKNQPISKPEKKRWFGKARSEGEE